MTNRFLNYHKCTFMKFDAIKSFCKLSPVYPKETKQGIGRRLQILYALLYTIPAILYRRTTAFFEKKKYKYNLGIVAIAKNEKEYISEWCAFHKAAGFDIIYLFDNESDDGTAEALTPYIDSGFVKYHHIKGRAKQIEAYNYALKSYCNECKYIAFVDCDEFLFIQPTAHVSLKDKIESFFKEHKNAGGLALNWCMYGSNGLTQKPEGLCIENFVKRALVGKAGTLCIKTILSSQKAKCFCSPHYPIYKTGYAGYDQEGKIVETWYNPITHYSDIRLNHYFCKSKEQWIRRRSLGAATLLDTNIKRTLTDFIAHDNNDITDTDILYYLDKTKKILNSAYNN